MQKVRSTSAWKGTAWLLGLLLLVLAAPGLLAQEEGPDPIYEVLDPGLITKYVTELVKPPAFPKAAKVPLPYCLLPVDYYEIGVRQFEQQILPEVDGFNPTTVWSYGPADEPRNLVSGSRFNYPAFTIEAKWLRPVVVKWVNQLVDENGNYLPHLLPVDQTLHWANPPGPRDMEGTSQDPYTGPVPIVTHVHGAHTFDWSDGYTEAWFLPKANDLPSGIYKTGTFYDYFNQKYKLGWKPGSATYTYPNNQRAGTLWYHDHTLGMTRVNVYAGPAGFFLLRGGLDDRPIDSRTRKPAVLPGPAPGVGADPLGTYYEIPIAIQDRTFKTNGQLFYPPHRAFFEDGRAPDQLQIPFKPDPVIYDSIDGTSDVPKIWNPEFFGNTMVVNGRTWPYLEVEPRRYRFRLLNGCNSRFLILQLDDANVPVWWIGTEGGFLPAPVNVNTAANGRILLGPAERADVIVDFTGLADNTEVILLNFGPDEPFGGGEPGEPPEQGGFEPADPATTGQVMKFIVKATGAPDPSTDPRFLKFPRIRPLNPTVTRQVSLNEVMSQTVLTSEQGENIVLDPAGTPFGPVAALLGILDANGAPVPLRWSDGITENPALFATEVWEIHNFTVDAHPIHIHEVMFQVVNREPMATPPPLMPDGDDPPIVQVRATVAQAPSPPEAWERGWKDTVIAYPGQITRVRMRFDLPGFFVWHCHIVEHEDNEMMRPLHVGKLPADAPIGLLPTPPTP